MNLSEFHAQFANTALYYFLLISLWGYWRFFRKQGLDASYWGAVVIAEVLLLIQSGIGTYLWIIGLRPARGMHVLYGIVSLTALPAVYIYTKGRSERADMLMYSTTALITVGLLLRAIFTAQVALGG